MGGGAHVNREDPVAVPAPDAWTGPRALTLRTAPQPLVKRVLDVVLSLAGLLVTAPLSMAIALTIKLEDGGPVLYRQKRWGRGGAAFNLYKFRTMVADSDLRFGIRQALADDERVTRVGRLLRATGMDELPQFVNILLGDMSFVGPRALALSEHLQAT